MIFLTCEYANTPARAIAVPMPLIGETGFLKAMTLVSIISIIILKAIFIHHDQSDIETRIYHLNVNQNNNGYCRRYYFIPGNNNNNSLH